ncbi:MAG: hypothetical protein U9N86_19265 [Bacteroidota bacterium]|nr:hypothetical protein [Bacteroidota bacterium]
MRRFLIMFLFLGIMTSVSAQYKDGPLRLTISGVSNLSWLFSDYPDNIPGSVRAGGAAEFHIDYFFEPNFAFSSGICWSLSGGNMIYSKPTPMSFGTGIYNLPAGTELTYRLQFVEIPLGLKLISREIGYSTFFTDFGIDPMLRIRATGDTSDGIHEKDQIIEEVSLFNVAYHSELGVSYSLGNNTSVVLAFFYKNTFLDFTTDNLNKPHDTSRINLAGIKLGFGF